MQLATILTELHKRNVSHQLVSGRRGIEKEGLRYSIAHKLSQLPHPSAYGSPLTHAEITTDYAESLLEIVTPAFRNSRDTLAHLCYLHRVLAHGNHDEYMLNGSMPAHIADTESVEIGQYGNSNAGKMRRLYRKGLALRYGKAMQLISGMHFNYSIGEELFAHYAAVLGREYTQAFINERYMNMVRNIRKYAWLTAYLFGHSPAVDKSFFGDRPHHLQAFDAETLYLPFATSLRLSDIGYQNKTGHLVSANTLSRYIHDLAAAVMTPNPDYAAQGLKDANGDYQQINTHLLQIENEYYTAVRPKQMMNSGEATVKALHERGIAYVELRTLDINCFERTGISQIQLDFLELFMLFCLLTDAPAFSDKEEEDAKNNLAKTSCCGRDPALKLQNGDHAVSIPEWGSEILNAMRPIAEAMDCEKHRPHYVSILEREVDVIQNPSLTPSARIMATLKGEATGKPMTYHQFITDLSLKHARESRDIGLTSAELEKVKHDAKASLDKERALVESSTSVSFEDYLHSYFSQLRDL